MSKDSKKLGKGRPIDLQISLKIIECLRGGQKNQSQLAGMMHLYRTTIKRHVKLLLGEAVVKKSGYRDFELSISFEEAKEHILQKQDEQYRLKNHNQRNRPIPSKRNYIELYDGRCENVQHTHIFLATRIHFCGDCGNVIIRYAA